MAAIKQHCHGFTLIETMVVLMVITITATVIGVRYTSSESDAIQQEGHRLALLLRYAAEVARTSGQPVAWSVSNDTYSFLKLEPNHQQWRLIMDDEPLRKRALPNALHIRDIAVNNAAITTGTGLIFSPSGLNPNFTITLTSGASLVTIAGDLAGNIVDRPYVTVSR